MSMSVNDDNVESNNGRDNKLLYSKNYTINYILFTHTQ